MHNLCSLCTVVSFSLFLAFGNAEAPSTVSTPLRDMNIDIPEGEYNETIHQFHKTKPDVVRFLLSGEKNNLFHLTSPAGALHLLGTLDRETKASYALKIEAFNQNGVSVEGPFSINIIVEDINDNPPVFNQSSYTTTVRERFRPGRTFFTVYASDPDDPATPNAQLFYSILRQVPGTDSPRLFVINKATGEISTTAEGYEQLDPVNKKEFELVVEVFDGAGLSENALSASVKVYISVTESLWKTPAPVNVKENSTGAYPIKITQVRCNEPNANYVLFQKGTLDSFPFSIDNQGDIYVTEPLDREKNSSYVFSASARDKNGNWLERWVEVVVKVDDINDNPPVCEKALTRFEVQENEGIGSSIGTLTATDLDLEPVLNYKLLDQVPKLPADNMFIIREYAGVVQLAKGQLQKKKVSQYNLTVEVSDDARAPEPVFKTTCLVQINVIDINMHTPQFVNFDYGSQTFPEDVLLGTVILQIQATDEDEPYTGSSAIVYTVRGDPTGVFSIETDPRTNIGYVKIIKPLDFETFPKYDLLVEARNPEPLLKGVVYGQNSTTRFRVMVTDVDEPPIFNETVYDMNVLENVPINTKVGKVLAYDPEGGPIRYSLAEDKQSWLRIDPNTGEIFTAADLDREIQEIYFVRVLATEVARPSMESSVLLLLTLHDVNDNAPMLTAAQPAASFCYPLRRKETVVVGAKDADSFINGPRFTFSFVPDEKTQQNWAISSINRTHASLTMKHTDFEMRDHNVRIKIKDRGTPPMEAQSTVQVRICQCTEANICVKSDVEEETKFPTVGMAIGILVGVLAFIAIIIGAVFISMNHKKKKAKKADSADAKNKTETENLGL